jgi:hypothetical protein
MSTAMLAGTEILEAVIHHFSLSYRLAIRNLEDVSDSQARLAPQPAGNSMYWVTRHVLATRDRIFPALAQQPLLESGSPSIDELKKAFGESQDRLVNGIRSLTDEKLAAAAPFSPTGGPLRPLGEFLLTSAFHEAYHVGQLGILRRLLGKKGMM